MSFNKIIFYKKVQKMFNIKLNGFRRVTLIFYYKMAKNLKRIWIFQYKSIYFFTYLFL
jgi:hypothetical protein